MLYVKPLKVTKLYAFVPVDLHCLLSLLNVVNATKCVRQKSSYGNVGECLLATNSTSDGIKQYVCVYGTSLFLCNIIFQPLQREIKHKVLCLVLQNKKHCFDLLCK